MKLTEEKLKQMIKEAMEIPPLPHLDKITDLLSSSFEEGITAGSFIDSLDEYILKYDVEIDRGFTYIEVIRIFLKHANQAQELFDALEPKMPERGRNEYPKAMVSIAPSYSYVTVVWRKPKNK